MLVLALVLSLVFLLIANLSAHAAKRPMLTTAMFGIAFTVLSVNLFSPPINLAFLLQTMLLCLMVPLLSGRDRRVIRFLGGSLLATLALYCLPIREVMQEQEKLNAIREQVPYVSLDDRLPERPGFWATRLTDDSIKRLDGVENLIDHTGGSRRTRELRLLHEYSTRMFIDSPGFGNGRMATRPSFATIGQGRPLIPQPGGANAITSASEEPKSPPGPWNGEKLEAMHRDSVVDFVNPQGFGYVRDRQHVAGFNAHGLSKVPEASKPLQVVSIELVGLLRDEPVVYVSDYIPEMSELRKAPTRRLDPFEFQGVKRLQSGQDLHIEQMPSSLRMLGAIRSTKQCISCHGGGRGDLLGAFSYTLR